MPFHHAGIVFQDPGYGVLVRVHPHMFERHLDVSRRHPHARQHQGQRDIQARHVAVFKSQIVPEPPPAYGAFVDLHVFMLAAVPPVADVFRFLAAGARQSPLLDCYPPAVGGLGTDE